MKIEAKLFEILTMFFILVAIIYGVFTALSRHRYRVGRTDGHRPVCRSDAHRGYLLPLSSPVVWTPRPEDYDDAEISDGAGELGFFSPGSFWPILLAAAAALAAVSLAYFQPWSHRSRSCLCARRSRRPGVRVLHRTREALVSPALEQRRRTHPGTAPLLSFM